MKKNHTDHEKVFMFVVKKYIIKKYSSMIKNLAILQNMAAQIRDSQNFKMKAVKKIWKQGFFINLSQRH